MDNLDCRYKKFLDSYKSNVNYIDYVLKEFQGDLHRVISALKPDFNAEIKYCMGEQYFKDNFEPLFNKFEKMKHEIYELYKIVDPDWDYT